MVTRSSSQFHLCFQWEFHREKSLFYLKRFLVPLGNEIQHFWIQIWVWMINWSCAFKSVAICVAVIGMRRLLCMPHLFLWCFQVGFRY
ncbi:hypothetical protein VIGAN_04099700 [Vigna angularis var. angularis]|uniref:Uncharacterized protein n=1 Tax=Vigna angularis var. angularis TaxID=157739 RepID=A0A0S3RT59_PHAAN|nr:hypothetical protein VIGAN_04099700 [Vigna angularis var. angularis]